MADDESLLDVFVVVGIKETGENVDQYVERVKKTFGELGTAGVKGPTAVRKSVESIREEFERLAATARLTGSQIERMAKLAQRLDDAAISMANLRRNAFLAGGSVNALGNNAYQLGQAFEDAAVGFSLNGISGAVRGATNNISFLIQNLTQAKIAQAQLMGQTVSPLLTALPLYAAIGGAIALITVGPLSDWIESLNDIESKSKNLADVLKREFSDARFLVSLELDAQSALKAIQDAKTAQEAISEVIKQAEDANKLKFKITSELDRVSERRVFEGIGNALDELQAAASERLKQVSKEVVFTDPDALSIPVVVPPDPKNIQTIENIAAAIETVRIATKQAFDQAAKGLVDPGALETARDGVRRIQDGYDELVASGVLSAEAAENLKANLEAMHAPLQDLTEEAKRFQAIQENLLQDGLEALGLFKELSDEYRFLDAVNQGRLDKEDKILFDLQQQQVELQKIADKARELFGQNNPQVEAAIANEEQNLGERQRIDLTTEILDLEKEIAAQRANAAEDAERAAKRRMDLEEKIAEEQIEGGLRVQAADAALQKEIDRQAKDAQQKLIQDRIDALQKMDKTSQKSSLGDTGTIAFGDNVQPEIERLQNELKKLRDDEAKKAAADRIRDLENRIVAEQEEFHRRIEELHRDLEAARQEEVDALNKNAEEIQRLIDQLRQFQEAMLQIQGGAPLGIPEIGAGGERNGPLFLPEDDINGIGNAQANANAAAMDNVDFKSSSLETLTEQTNRILLALNDGVSRLDMQTRLA